MLSQDDFDALPDGAVVADADHRVTAANREAARLLGTSLDTMVGRALEDVLTLQDHDGRSWCRCNKPYGGIGIRTGVPEQSWIAPDGNEVLVTAQLHRDVRMGAVTQVALGLRSGRARARLDRERSDLVATVAHELRSPLTGVKGFVQALLNRWDKLNDEQKKLMLTTVHADSDRLSRLITELLDVARLDTGRLALHPRPSDVDVLVQRVIDNIQAGATHDIRYQSSASLPDVWADPDKFTQVVTNVVENAVRHGEGAVHIAAAALDDQVVLTVDDEGPGIPPEIRQRAFTKFWTSGQRGGSGLGLYLVNGLTRAHGGSVEIHDAPSGGARIVVSWPTADPLLDAAFEPDADRAP